jgi:4-hydroxy-tetrahydrodipicolinate synthase
MADVPAPPFGRVLTAMVTPFDAEGGLDLEGASRLARFLVDAGNDGLVVNGTTGESPTTTDDEKVQLVRAVVEAVGERASVVAGVGTNDTRHSVELAQAAAEAGAHGVLVVTPYYNRPPQPGIVRHFTAVADATDLPAMLYDIPVRTGVPIATETLVELAGHERIVAVKDAKDDLAASAEVIARTGLAYYSGSDPLTLPLLAVGGVGTIGVVTHVVAREVAAMVAAWLRGDTAEARAINARLIPVYKGTFRTQGVILTKATLALLGLPGGPVRSPLVDATPDQVAQLRTDLVAGGVSLEATAATGGSPA